jgi:predicted DNA-binding transcriptional regulator AlpA
MSDRILIDAKSGAALLGISPRSYANLVKTPGFPAARSLGPRSVRWLRSEIEDYAASLPAVTRNEPPQLAAARAAKAAGRAPLPAPFVG